MLRTTGSDPFFSEPLTCRLLRARALHVDFRNLFTTSPRHVHEVLVHPKTDCHHCRHGVGLCLPRVSSKSTIAWSEHQPPREGARLPCSELVYELEYSGSGAADLGALFGQASRSDLNAFHQTIKGRLGVKVCSVAADKSVVVFTLSPSTVSLQSGFSEISNHSLMADFSLPIVATVNDKGRILSVCFDQLASPQAQHLIRTILAATQIVLPESGSTATAWLTVEDDPNGEFDASYTVRDDKVVRKTKLHYAEPLPDSVDDIVFTPTCIPDGESLAQFDARGCMTALSVAEQQTLWLNGKCLGTTQLGLELNLVQTNTVNIEKMKDMTAKLNLDAAMSRGVRLSVRSTAAETNLILQRQSLGNSTVRDIVTKLVELDEGTANQADKTSLFLKCKARQSFSRNPAVNWVAY